jgi:hypothetical protein
MTNRKQAEQCRREALSIEAQPSTTAEQEALRAHLVSVWNTFCSEESARIDRTGDAYAYIRPRFVF